MHSISAGFAAARLELPVSTLICFGGKGGSCGCVTGSPYCVDLNYLTGTPVDHKQGSQAMSITD